MLGGSFLTESKGLGKVVYKAFRRLFLENVVALSVVARESAVLVQSMLYVYKNATFSTLNYLSGTIMAPPPVVLVSAPAQASL